MMVDNFMLLHGKAPAERFQPIEVPIGSTDQMTGKPHTIHMLYDNHKRTFVDLPQVPIQRNPAALAILADEKLSGAERDRKLMGLGYGLKNPPSAGMKQVGTSGGQPIYEDKNGKRFKSD